MAESRTDWMAEAACARDPWFLEHPVQDRHAVCADCCVRSECLEFGVAERGAIFASSRLTYGGISGEELARKARTHRRNPNRQRQVAS